MKCDNCRSFVHGDLALHTTYDIDGLYMQFSFCDEGCRDAFEKAEDMTTEETLTRNDA